MSIGLFITVGKKPLTKRNTMFAKLFISLALVVYSLSPKTTMAIAPVNDTQLLGPTYNITLDLTKPDPIEFLQSAKPNYDNDVLKPIQQYHIEQAAQEAAAAQAAQQAEEAAQAAEQARLDAIQQRQSTFYSDTYAWGNCTYWVASQRGVPGNWGNANQWAANAAADGWTVSNTPVIGAIAQTPDGYYGHVAFVTGIGLGTVTVSEMNVEGLDVVDIHTYPVSYFTYLY